MSLSKPFRLRNNRLQTPWISTYILHNPENSKTQTIKVLKHICGPLEDGSMVREVTDGELYIKTVFSNESILDFYKELDDCTPPEWNSALLILKKFHIDIQLSDSFEKSEYILYVDSFILWDLQEGFELKNTLTHCMENDRIKEKAKEIWLLKQGDLSQTDTMHSIPLTQLLEQMTQGDSQDEDISANDLTDISTNDQVISKLNPHEQLIKPFVAADFLVDVKEEKILKCIKEWKLDYKPSLSEEDSSVTTPEMDPGQPTLRDDHQAPTHSRYKETQKNNKEKANEIQVIIIEDKGNEENMDTSEGVEQSKEQESNKVTIDEAEEPLIQMETEGETERKDKNDLSGPSNSSVTNLENKKMNKTNTRSIYTSQADVSEISNNLSLTNKMEQANNQLKNNDVSKIQIENVKTNLDLSNEMLTPETTCVKNNTENKQKTRVLMESSNSLKDGVKMDNGNRDCLEKGSNSGPFVSYSETQEFIPTISPSSDKENNDSFISSSQEFIPQSSNFKKSFENNAKEFVPQRLEFGFSAKKHQRDIGNSNISSPPRVDSTSADNVESPLLYEDGHEQIENRGLEVNALEDSMEQIKYLAIPVGKVLETPKEVKSITNHGDIESLNCGDILTKEKHLSDQVEEKRLQILATPSGDNSGSKPELEESCRLDILSTSGKKKRLRPENDYEDASDSDNGQTKRRRLRAVSDDDIQEKKENHVSCSMDTERNIPVAMETDESSNQSDKRRSSSKFSMMANKIFDFIGITPVKKSECERTRSPHEKLTKTKDDINIEDHFDSSVNEELETSDAIDKQEDLFITSTSNFEEKHQFESHSQTVKDMTVGNKDDDHPLQENSLTSYQPQQQTDSELTSSLDTHIDKEEFLDSLLNVDPHTEIGKKLLEIKFPAHVLERIGRYYLDT